MGTKSPIKLKLRSNTFKCDLCGRKYTSSAALNFHQQCVHSKAMKTLKTDTRAASKPKKVVVKIKQPVKSKKTAVPAKKKGIPQSKVKAMKKPQKTINKRVTIQKPPVDVENSPECDISEPEFRRTKFECPKCRRIYSVYFQAYKHIQKYHCTNIKGQEVKPIPIELCTLCRRRLTSAKHVCAATKELEDIKFASEYTCSGCDASFISMKMYDLHVSGLHSDGVESMFFPTVKEFYDWKLDMEDKTKIKYTVVGKYNSKQYYRCSYMPFIKEPDSGTAFFCPSTIVIQQFPKGIQVHFYKKHYGHQSVGYELSENCRKYNITTLVKNLESSDELDLKCYEVELYTELKNLMTSIIVDASKARDSTLKKLLGKALEMTSILNSSGEINKESTETVEIKNKNQIMTDTQISEALENAQSTKPVKVQRVSPAKRAAEEEKVNAKRAKRETTFDNSVKIVDSFSIADRPDIVNVLKEDSKIKKAEKQNIDKSKNSSKKDGNVVNDSPRPKVNRVNFMASPTFNDTYKDFVDKNFKVCTEKKKSIVKTKIGQFNPSPPKSAKNKSKKTQPTDLSKVKITDYEVKERENDCNILILKI